MADWFTEDDVESAARAIMREAGCVRFAHDSLPRCDVHVAAWRGDLCRDAYDHARAVLTSLSAQVAQERAEALREFAAEHRRTHSTQHPIWPTELDFRADEIERGAAQAQSGAARGAR